MTTTGRLNRHRPTRGAEPAACLPHPAVSRTCRSRQHANGGNLKPSRCGSPRPSCPRILRCVRRSGVLRPRFGGTPQAVDPGPVRAKASAHPDTSVNGLRCGGVSPRPSSGQRPRPSPATARAQPPGHRGLGRYRVPGGSPVATRSRQPGGLRRPRWPYWAGQQPGGPSSWWHSPNPFAGGVAVPVDDERRSEHDHGL